MKLDYKANIQVLHIEDDKIILGKISKELTKTNITFYQATNLNDALNLLDKIDFDLIISDGQFPNRAGEEIQKNFIRIAEEVKNKKTSSQIIAWANSTHVHEYCSKNDIISFSKIKLTKEKFQQKGRQFIDVQVKDAIGITRVIKELINNKINLAELNIKKLESYYKEPATFLAIFMAADMRTGWLTDTAGINYGPMVSKFEDGVVDLYLDPTNDGIIASSIFKKIQSGYFTELQTNVYKKAKNLLDFSRKLREQSWSSLKDKELGDLYLEFCQKFIEMRTYSSLPTAMESGTNLWTNYLQQILDGKIIDAVEKNKVFSLLTTPEKRSYLQEFDIQVIKTAIESPNNEEKINSIASNFAWIHYAFEGVPITSNDVKEKIKELVKSDNLNEKLQEYESKADIIVKEKEVIYQRYAFSQKEKEAFEIGAEIVFIKFFRKGIFAEAYYSCEFLQEEIARRLDCDRKDVVNMLPNEVLAALEVGNFPVEIVRNRIKSSLLLHNKGRTFPLSDDYWDYFSKFISKNNMEIFKGQTAYPGKAKGKVKIINVPADIKKFETGDILVSRSTNPSLISAMKKAGGIITDLGGLTCHAAIVARELKVPCIVGTKNATAVLNDGDNIEMDADNNTIKIL